MKQLFFILALVLFSISIHAQDKVYTVLVLKDWKPYYSLDKNGKPIGYAIELFEALAKDIGINYKYQILDNWSELNSYWKTNKEYIIPNIGIAKNRAPYIQYSNPTDTFQISYFKREISNSLHSQLDLINKKVAIVKFNVCEKLVSTDMEKVLYEDHLTALTNLLSGQVDAMCYPKPLLENALTNLNLSDKVIAFGKPLKEIKRGIGFSPTNAHLLEQFNSSIKKIQNNKTYEKIYLKWFTQKNIQLTYQELITYTLLVSILIIILIFTTYYLVKKRQWQKFKSKLQQEIEDVTSNLQEAQKISKLGSWSLDIAKNKLIWSNEIFNIFEIDKNKFEASYEAFLNAIHPEDRDAVNKAYINSLKTQKPYSITHRLLMDDGRVKWVLEECRTNFDKKGNPLVSIGTVQDITEKYLNEQEIKNKKEEFETFFKSVREGIAIIDLETKFLDCNDAFINLLGYSKDELLTKTCSELTVEEDRIKNKEAISHAIKYNHYENFEKKCISKSGKTFPVNMSISLLPNKKRLLLSIKDMTSIKLLEEQSKLASMGEMIGNIAHQWRQPLSIITTSASGLNAKAKLQIDITNEEIESFSNQVVEQANYLSSTIDDFKNFIKDDKSNQQLSIKKCLEERLNLTNASIKDTYINLTTDIKADLQIEGNPNELTQALINLFNNAKDALEELPKEIDKQLFLSTRKVDTTTIEIEILDNGGGIKEEIIDRIFEPYFTTKHQSIGTGLGLSMVDKIIRERFKGSITAYNKEFKFKGNHYKGACFVITLTQ